MTLPANIRVNVSAPFPSLVLGTGGINVVKVNGVWTISPDFAALSVITSLADPTSKEVWVFDPVTGVYNVMTLAVLVSLFAGTVGTGLLDFGAFPGASDATLTVTGLPGISASAAVEAWISPVATSDHTADEHLANPPRVYAGNIVANVGFTIYGVNDDRGDELTYGKWSVNWRYQ